MRSCVIFISIAFGESRESRIRKRSKDSSSNTSPYVVINKMSTARIQPTASVLSSTIKHHLVPNLHPPSNSVVLASVPRRFGFRRAITVEMSSSSAPKPLEALAKASVTVPNKLGDCKSILLHGKRSIMRN